MATYTVKTLIAPKTMGNGSANIATWQYNNTGTAESVVRTFTFSGQAGATGTVTAQIGVTGATASAAETILDAVPIAANTPTILNGWYTVPVSSFLAGYAANTTTSGGAFGLIST